MITSLYLFKDFTSDSWRKNMRSLQEWSESVGQQQQFGVDFVDAPGASVARAMKRVAVTGPKGIGFILPWNAGLVALALAADAPVTAGSASLQLRSGGVAVSAYAPLVWSAGSATFATYDPSAWSIAAGSVIDVAVTTTAGYAPGTQELICTAILTRFS